MYSEKSEQSKKSVQLSEQLYQVFLSVGLVIVGFVVASFHRCQQP